METRNNTLKKYDADTLACIQSAYGDLQLMIKDIFTNIYAIPDQLSFEDFIFLFKKYDWQDIIDKVEEVNFFIDSNNSNSVYNCLLNSLIDDVSVKPIKGLQSNTYLRYRTNKTDPS